MVTATQTSVSHGETPHMVTEILAILGQCEGYQFMVLAPPGWAQYRVRLSWPEPQIYNILNDEILMGEETSV